MFKQNFFNTKIMPEKIHGPQWEIPEMTKRVEIKIPAKGLEYFVEEEFAETFNDLEEAGISVTTRYTPDGGCLITFRSEKSHLLKDELEDIFSESFFPIGAEMISY